MTDSDSLKLDITYVDIHELRFLLEQDYMVEQFDPEKVRVTFNMDTGYNLETLVLAVDIVIHYLLIIEEVPTVLLEYHTRTEFEIKQLADQIKNGVPTATVLYPAVDVAMNMTRGMMAVRTFGSSYRSSLPPLVDPLALIAPYLRFHAQAGKEIEKDGV